MGTRHLLGCCLVCVVNTAKFARRDLRQNPGVQPADMAGSNDTNSKRQWGKGGRETGRCQEEECGTIKDASPVLLERLEFSRPLRLLSLEFGLKSWSIEG